MRWSEAFGTMYPAAKAVIEAVRSRWDSQRQGGQGLESDGMANGCEPSSNHRQLERAKDADRLMPNGTRHGTGASQLSCHGQTAAGGEKEPVPSWYFCGTR